MKQKIAANELFLISAKLATIKEKQKFLFDSYASKNFIGREKKILEPIRFAVIEIKRKKFSS